MKGGTPKSEIAILYEIKTAEEGRREQERTRPCPIRKRAVRSCRQYLPQNTRVLCGKYSSTLRRVRSRLPQSDGPTCPKRAEGIRRILIYCRIEAMTQTEGFIRKQHLAGNGMKPQKTSAYDGRESHENTNKVKNPERAPKPSGQNVQTRYYDRPGVLPFRHVSHFKDYHLNSIKGA